MEEYSIFKEFFFASVWEMGCSNLSWGYVSDSLLLLREVCSFFFRPFLTFLFWQYLINFSSSFALFIFFWALFWLTSQSPVAAEIRDFGLFIVWFFWSWKHSADWVFHLIFYASGSSLLLIKTLSPEFLINSEKLLLISEWQQVDGFRLRRVFFFGETIHCINMLLIWTFYCCVLLKVFLPLQLWSIKPTWFWRVF